MIKISYNQPAYWLDTIKEGQNYDITTEIKLNEDCSASEAIETFVKLLNIATYRINAAVLLDIVYELQEKYGKDIII